MKEVKLVVTFNVENYTDFEDIADALYETFPTNMRCEGEIVNVEELAEEDDAA